MITDQQAIQLATIVRYHNQINARDRYTFQHISANQAIVTRCHMIDGNPWMNEAKIVNISSQSTANMIWEKEFGINTDLLTNH